MPPPPTASTEAGHPPSEHHFTLTAMSLLEVMADRDSLQIIDDDGDTSVMIRVGEVVAPVWDCASCGSALIIGVEPGQVIDIVLRCRICRGYNHTSR